MIGGGTCQRALSPSQEDPRFLEGVALFNRGAFFEAHEVWEDLWHEEVGEYRLFVQGLIQIAGGLFRLQAADPGRAINLLKTGVDKLGRCRARHGINAVEVRERAAEILALVREGRVGEAGPLMPRIEVDGPAGASGAEDSREAQR